MSVHLSWCHNSQQLPWSEGPEVCCRSANTEFCLPLDDSNNYLIEGTPKVRLCYCNSEQLLLLTPSHQWDYWCQYCHMLSLSACIMELILLFSLYRITSSSCHKLLPSPPVGWLNSLLSPGCRNTKLPMNIRIMWISWGGATSVRRAKRFANAATKCSDKCLEKLRKFISCRKNDTYFVHGNKNVL